MKQLNKRLLFLLVMLGAICSRGTVLYWSGDGVSQGGVGTWNTTTARWSTNSAGGPFDQVWNNTNIDSAVLDSVAGVVTLGTPITNENITVSITGYSLAGSQKITFQGANAGVNYPAVTTSFSINCPMGTSPGSVFTKTGAGRVALNNSNNTISKYRLNAGVLSAAAANRFGTAPGSVVPDFLTFDGGAFGADTTTAYDLGSTRGITLATGGGKFGVSSATITLTLSAPITGGGLLSFPGTGGFPATFGAAGTFILSNTNNNYTGGTTVQTGTLRLDVANVLPNGTTLTLNGGDFDVLTNSDTIAKLVLNSSSSAITTTGGGGTLTATNGYDVRNGTCAAILAGAGVALTKTTANTVDLTGANTFTGGVLHNAGTLRVNNNAALGAANSPVTLANGVTLSTTAGTTRTLTYAFTVNGDIILGQATTGTGILILAGSVNLAGGTPTLQIDNPVDTISGVITNGGLTKAGTGTLTLSAANTYAGPTTVNDGTLTLTGANTLTGDITINAGRMNVSGTNFCTGLTAVNGGKLFTTTASAGAGIYSVADGASLSLSMTSASASLNVSDLTLGNCTTEFDFARFGFPSSKAVNDANSLNVNGSVTVDVKGFNTTGTATLIEYAGARNGVGSFILGTVPPHVVASIDETITNKVILNATAADTLVWVGDASGNWDTNNPANQIWKLAVAGTPTEYQENAMQGDTVRFDNTATGTAAVNVTVQVSPFTVTVDNSVTNYSFIGTGKISGSGSLTKSGTGEITITTTNDYTGGTTLNAGTLSVGANAALGTGKLTINGNVLIRSDSVTSRTLSVATDLNANLTLGDAVNIGDLTFQTGAWTIKGASRQITVDTINATINSVIGQDVAGRGLTKSGAGTLSLGGANTFSGGFTHSAGTVRVNNSTALGAANSTVDLANGVTLSTTTTTARILTNAFNINGDITLGQVTGGTAAVTLAGSVNLGGANRTFNLVTNAGISAVITNGGLTKMGTGTLTLTGNNLYSGDTTNSQGFISLNNTVATPFGVGGTLYLTGGHISTSSGNRDTVPILNPVVMLADTTFEGDTAGAGFRNFPINGQITTVAGVLTVKNTGTTNGIWNPRFQASGMNFTQPIVIGVSGDLGGTQLSSYNTNGGGDQTFSGEISGYGVFSRGASVAGTGGTTILTASNTYSGGTVVSDGILLVNNVTGSGTGSGTVNVTSGGTLGGTGTVAGAVVVTNANIAAGASVGTLTLGGALDLSAGGTNVWELGANSTSGPGTSFDQLILSGGNLALGGTSRLQIKFVGSATFPDKTNAFWQATNTWKVISLTGTATNAGPSHFSGIDGASGNNAGVFTTSVDGSGSVFLTFTPGVLPPAPVIDPKIVGAGTTSAQVSWSSVAGASYTVQYKSNLNQIGWLDLTNILASGTTTTIADATSPVPPERYYRVVSP